MKCMHVPFVSDYYFLFVIFFSNFFFWLHWNTKDHSITQQDKNLFGIIKTNWIEILMNKKRDFEGSGEKKHFFKKVEIFLI